MKFDFKKNFENRQSNENITSKNLEDLLKVFDYSKQSMTEDEIKKYVDCRLPENIPEKISQTEMKENAKQIKFLIKNLYSGYKFFGEDFFENCFSKIEKFAQEKESATPEEFNFAIAQSFEGLKDGHFCVKSGTKRNKPIDLIDEFTFYNANNLIEEENGNYYFNGQKICLINEKEPKGYIKTVCTPDGKLKLGIIARLPRKEKTTKIKCLMANGEKIEISLLKKDFEINKKNETENAFGFVKKENSCLYIKNITCLLNSKEKIDEFEKFLQTIKEQNQNIDYYIIDARGNRGGSDEVTTKIICEILNMDKFVPEIHGVNLCSRFPIGVAKNDNEMYQKSIWNEYQKSIANGTPYLTPVNLKNNKSKDNGKNVFILTDKLTFSAGERYASDLASFSNVVMLNDNTGGGNHFGNITYYTLNNSKVTLSLANTFFMNTKNFTEIKGFQPDIYFACQNKDVLKTLKNFIEKNVKIKNDNKEK